MQLADTDQELYKNFNITISERWQQEIADTIFELVNQDADKAEQKKRAKQKLKMDVDEKGTVVSQNAQKSMHWDKVIISKKYCKDSCITPGGYTNINSHFEQGVIHEEGIIHESVLRTLFPLENTF